MPKEVPAGGRFADRQLKLFVTAAEVNKNLAYMVIYNDYPEAITAARLNRFSKAREGSKGTGKVVTDKEITLGVAKTPGRDYVLDKGGNFFVLARF
jgi:hypothetical protein